MGSVKLSRDEKKWLAALYKGALLKQRSTFTVPDHIFRHLSVKGILKGDPTGASVTEDGFMVAKKCNEIVNFEAKEQSKKGAAFRKKVKNG
jgi:hypothetical protein